MIDDQPVESLLDLPLHQAVVARIRDHSIAGPAQLIRVQLHRESGFGVILGGRMQVVELVNVPQVHLLAIELVLVEVLQIYDSLFAANNNNKGVLQAD